MKARLNKVMAALVPVLGLAAMTPSMAADANRPAADNKASTQRAAQMVPARDVRMSHLIGMEVRDAKGERIGEINDVVVDLNAGKAQYAVVGFGGMMGVGEKLFAYPMSSFKVMAEPGRTAALDRPVTNTARGTGTETRDRSPGNPLDNDGVRGDKGPVGSDRAAANDRGNRDRVAAPRLRDVHLVLNVDKDQLKNAKGFEKNNWPDVNDAKFRSDVDAYAGANRVNRASADTGKASANADRAHASAKLHRASKLIDADVRDAQNKDIGDVEDVVVNLQTGDLHYAVIEFDKGWLQGDKLVAVPIRALAYSADGKNDKDVRLNADRSRLERAPAFSKNAWPDLDRGQFRTDVDRYLATWSSGAPDRSVANRGAGESATTGAAPAGNSAPRTTGAAGTTTTR